MATITGGGQTITLNFGSNEVAGQLLAAQVTASLRAGTTTFVATPVGPPGAGSHGAFVQGTPNQQVVLGTLVSTVVDTSTGAETVFGGGGVNQRLLASNAPVTFLQLGGNGVGVTGDGGGLFGLMGGFNLLTGAGNDTIFAAGNNTINAGGATTSSWHWPAPAATPSRWRARRMCC